MNKLLAALFSRVYVAPAEVAKPARRKAEAANAELAAFGYTLSADALDALAASGTRGVDAFLKDSRSFLPELTGSSANHAALYNRFPYEVPEHRDYLFKRIVGHLRNELGLNGNDFMALSCGHVVDSDLFPDMSAFSACPICQRQVDELGSFDEVRNAYREVTPLKVLRLAPDGLVRELAQGLLCRNSSLSADERRLLSIALDRFGLDVPDSVYRENLPFAYAAANGDLDKVRPLLSGATDLLRIAVYVGDAEADLSLSEPVRFKVPGRHGRAILSLLDGLPSPASDMMRHRERWLRLGEHLHAGTAQNRRRYPSAAAAFDRLRRDPRSIPTFSRQVEAKLRAREVDAELVAALEGRPGEFMRRVDFMLREADDPSAVVGGLGVVAKDAKTEALLGLWKYLSTRLEPSGERVFVPKGTSTRVKVVEDLRKPIPPETVERAREVLSSEIEERLSRLPPLGSVYVDEGLRGRIVPFNRRGDSSTNVSVVKGNRFPMGEPPVVRLFAHWTGDIDVDLSLACFDEGFRHLVDVSFQDTTPAGWSMVHSGDVQRAPRGASEFIDFVPDILEEKGVRYVVAHVISYRGDAFESFPCFAGFMERDELKSGAKYEPKSVALKFDLKSRATDHMPLIFDLATREVVFADIAGGKGTYGTVRTSVDRIVKSAKAVLDFPRTKVTLWDVAMFHARARGDLCAVPEAADVVFSPETLDGVDVMDERAIEAAIKRQAKVVETVNPVP